MLSTDEFENLFPELKEISPAKEYYRPSLKEVINFTIPQDKINEMRDELQWAYKKAKEIVENEQLPQPKQLTHPSCPLCALNSSKLNKAVFWTGISSEDWTALLGIRVTDRELKTHREKHLIVEQDINVEDIKKRLREIKKYAKAQVDDDTLINLMINLLRDELMRLEKAGRKYGEDWIMKNELLLKWMKLKQDREADRLAQEGKASLEVLLRRLLRGE